MPTITFDNPTSRPAIAVLRGLLGCLFSPRYRNGLSFHLDPVMTRAARTRWRSSRGLRRAAVVEVALYEDGSGLEVAAFGWVMMTDVVPKRGREEVSVV